MQESEMDCPICKEKFATKRDFLNFTVCEEWGKCSCGYSYAWAYGHTEECFGPFEFRESYAGDHENNTFLSKRVALFVWRVWHSLKSLTHG